MTGTEFDLTDKVETLKTDIKTSVTNAINKVQFWAEETPAFVTNFANEVKVGITSSISNIDWSAVRTSLKTGVENAINGIEWFTGKVQLYTLKLWANVTSAFNSIDWSAVKTNIVTAINTVLTGITGQDFNLETYISTLKTDIQTRFSAAKTAVSSIPTTFS